MFDVLVYSGTIHVFIGPRDAFNDCYFQRLSFTHSEPRLPTDFSSIGCVTQGAFDAATHTDCRCASSLNWLPCI